MFSENLNKIMDSLGLTIKTLAGQMECDRSYIQRLCSGERVPKQNGRDAAITGLPGRRAPRAKHAIRPRSRVSRTTLRSYSPTGVLDRTSAVRSVKFSFISKRISLHQGFPLIPGSRAGFTLFRTRLPEAGFFPLR